MRTAVGLLLLSAAGALVTVALFFGESVSDSRLFWIGVFAEVLGFGAAALGIAGLAPVAVPQRAGLPAVGLLAAFVCWSGVTMVWSIAPDRSGSFPNPGAAIFGFA